MNVNFKCRRMNEMALAPQRPSKTNKQRRVITLQANGRTMPKSWHQVSNANSRRGASQSGSRQCSSEPKTQPWPFTDKHNKFHTNMYKFGRAMQHIVLISACSLALSASSVLCDGSMNALPVDSYVQQQNNALSMHNSVAESSKHPIRQRTPIYQSQEQLMRTPTSSLGTNVVNEFNSLASSTSTGTGLAPTSQPSVYHSIIDRVDAPNRRQASPAIQTSTATTAGDLHTAAGHHHDHAYGKYYEYRAVPKRKTWKFGYKRGNHKHTISRHEHGKAGKHPHFKTKVKWHDKKGKGKGIHLWDYNHHDKKHYHHG